MEAAAEFLVATEMEQLQAMGFFPSRCRRALAESDQNVEAALQFLCANTFQPKAWWGEAEPAAESSDDSDSGSDPDGLFEDSTAAGRRDIIARVALNDSSEVSLNWEQDDEDLLAGAGYRQGPATAGESAAREHTPAQHHPHWRRRSV